HDRGTPESSLACPNVLPLASLFHPGPDRLLRSAAYVSEAIWLLEVGTNDFASSFQTGGVFRVAWDKKSISPMLDVLRVCSVRTSDHDNTRRECFCDARTKTVYASCQIDKGTKLWQGGSNTIVGQVAVVVHPILRSL